MTPRFAAIAAAIAAAATATLARDARATVATPAHAHVLAVTGRPARVHRNVGWRAASTAASLASLPGWRGLWDADTDVPLRLWGPSLAAPGATADPRRAEAFARRTLAAHLDLIAPGARAADFELVADTVDPRGATRTVAFQQRSHGLRVIGGAISFAFARDRLIAIGSTAVPDVDAAIAAPVTALGARRRLSRAAIAANAITWLAGSGRATAERAGPAWSPLPAWTASLGAAGERVVLPIVHARGRGGHDIEARVAEVATLEATRGAGRWQVYVDAGDAAPIASLDLLAFAGATGTLAFDTPDQRPTSTRSAKGAQFALATANGSAVTTDETGALAFTGADPATVVTDAVGLYVAVTDAAHARSVGSLSLASGGSAVWSLAFDDSPASIDAEPDAYIAANRVKEFGQAELDPQLAFFTEQLSVTVNQDDVCNAYSTGDDIHFYQAGYFDTDSGSDVPCENLGRLTDIVFHETGHSIHAHSYIPGAGAYGTPEATALSEGLADTLAVSMTGDHGFGRGFYLDDTPLRDVAPVGIVKRWPIDADGEPHDEGEIIGETLWDLRVALMAKLGPTAGFARLLQIYYGIMQRSPDIPTSYVEALVADDDDGDLGNGTPNQCEIDTAFGRHGLAPPAVGIGLAPPTRAAYAIAVAAPARTDGCPTTVAIASAQLSWHAGSAGEGNGSDGGSDATIAMGADAAGNWTATVPTQVDGTTVSYQVDLQLADGTTRVFPDNPADPYYRFYIGQTTQLYCEGFESGLDGWTHGGSQDEWQVGTPIGKGGDPVGGHAGVAAAGIDLGIASTGSGVGTAPASTVSGDGRYNADANEQLLSPLIDVGAYTQVHLQLWRWLGVEDARYDHAFIAANGQVVWQNSRHSVAASGSDEVNHIDQEWMFQDIDVSPTLAASAAGQLQLAFDLTSDDTNNFGGWTIDDVCVVATAPAPPASGDDAGTSGLLTGTVAGGGGCAAGGRPAGGSLAAVGFALALALSRATARRPTYCRR